MKEIWWGLFKVYFLLYILLYFGYFIFIKALHSSYSVVSVPAVLLPFLLLLFFQFVLWKIYGDNFQSSKKRKNTMIIIIGIVLPLGCGIMLSINEYKSIFTTEKWLNHPSSRVYMVDHLLDKYDFEEMTKDEVIELLGTPPETNYFKESDNIVYYLGDERGLISIDSEWLIIEFDEHDNVKGYAVWRD